MIENDDGQAWSDRICLEYIHKKSNKKLTAASAGRNGGILLISRTHTQAKNPARQWKHLPFAAKRENRRIVSNMLSFEQEEIFDRWSIIFRRERERMERWEKSFLFMIVLLIYIDFVLLFSNLFIFFPFSGGE